MKPTKNSSWTRTAMKKKKSASTRRRAKNSSTATTSKATPANSSNSSMTEVALARLNLLRCKLELLMKLEHMALTILVVRDRLAATHQPGSSSTTSSATSSKTSRP